MGHLLKLAKKAYRRLRQDMSWWKNFGWMNMRYLQKRRKEDRRKHENVIDATPKFLEYVRAQCKNSSMQFAIFICVGVGGYSDEERTAASVEEQIHKGYRIYRMSAEDVGEEGAAACLNRLADGCGKDAFLFVQPGTELSPVTLWALEQCFVKTDADIVYADEKWRQGGAFKPDFGIDALLAQNYIGSNICISRAAWEKMQGFDTSYRGAYLYDLILRAYEANLRIVHWQQPVFYLPQMMQVDARSPRDGGMGLDALTEPTWKEELRAVRESLNRREQDAQVTDLGGGLRQIAYELSGRPLLSVIIPNKDHTDLLEQCIRSVVCCSTYDNYEILIIENNSEDAKTFAYYDRLQQREDLTSKTLYRPKISVIPCKTEWNYSYINNFGAAFAKGGYLVLLNNDTEVIAPDWMEQMLMYAQRQDVGAVGAKLFYPDGAIQHAGVTIGIRGVAGHAFHGWPGNASGYMNRLVTVQNLSGVTAACMMVPKHIFEEVGGFDEEYRVAFNDTDLCMRIRGCGYHIVYQPKAELYHHESKSRGTDEQSAEKLARFNRESMRFQRQYCMQLSMGDPYYNPYLKRDSDDFEIVEMYR